MITHFDHVYSPLRDNDLDATLARFKRAGFLVGDSKARHACGRLTGFAHMTGSYLEFLSVIDEAEFNREAAVEDRIFRHFPRPYGIGARTSSARTVHRRIKRLHPDTPSLMTRSRIESRDTRPVWTFCLMSRGAFPGANLFAIQYHSRRRDALTIRQGPNTIFALGGFVFCSAHVRADRAAWENSLRAVGRVVARGSHLECAGQQLEWISFSEYRRLMGRPYQSTPFASGGIAVVKLFCANLRDSRRYLVSENFTCVRAAGDSALFAPDFNTGYAFELIQSDPSAFLQSMRGVQPTKRRDAKPKAPKAKAGRKGQARG